MKTIVFDSPHQIEVTAVQVGLNFRSGEPKTVTDEQADVLLAVYANRWIEGDDDAVARMKNSAGAPYKPTRNPLVGKQKHPHFRLVNDESSASVRISAAPVAASVPSSRF